MPLVRDTKTLEVLLITPPTPTAEEVKYAINTLMQRMNRVLVPRDIELKKCTRRFTPSFSIKALERQLKTADLCVILLDEANAFNRYEAFFEVIHDWELATRKEKCPSIRVCCLALPPSSEAVDREGHAAFRAAGRSLHTVPDVQSAVFYVLGALCQIFEEHDIHYPVQVMGSDILFGEDLLLDLRASHYYRSQEAQAFEQMRCETEDFLIQGTGGPEMLQRLIEMEKFRHNMPVYLLETVKALCTLPFEGINDLQQRMVTAIDGGQMGEALRLTVEHNSEKTIENVVRETAEAPAFGTPDSANEATLTMFRIAFYLPYLCHAHEQQNMFLVESLKKYLVRYPKGLRTPAGGLLLLEVGYWAQLGEQWEYADFFLSKAYTFFDEVYLKTNTRRFYYLLAMRRLGEEAARKMDYKRADELFSRALKLARGWAVHNYPGFQTLVADVLNQIGNYHLGIGRNYDAETEISEALAIYRILEVTNPSYKPLVALMLSRLSDVLLKRDAFEEAERQVLEAVQLYHEMAPSDPNRFLPCEVEQLCHLSLIHYRMGEVEDARTDMELAIELFADNVSLTVEGIEELARLYSYYGYMSAELGDYEVAISAFRKSCQYYNRIARTNTKAVKEVVKKLRSHIDFLRKRVKRKRP